MFPTDRAFIRIASIMTLIVVLCFVGFGLSYCHQRDALKSAKANTRITRGESNAANAATGAVIDYADRQSERDATTNGNRDQILAAPNAADSAGDTGNVGLSVLCDRPALRSDPVCVRLKGSAAAR